MPLIRISPITSIPPIPDNNLYVSPISLVAKEWLMSCGKGKANIICK